MLPSKQRIVVWSLCLIAAGCTIDGREMTAYREQEKIWLQDNWHASQENPSLVKTPPPIPPKREKFPKCLAWVPFRIVFDSTSSDEPSTTDEDVKPPEPFKSTWNQPYIDPDSERERIRMGPLPPPYDLQSEYRKWEEEEERKKPSAFLTTVTEFFSSWSIEWD